MTFRKYRAAYEMPPRPQWPAFGDFLKFRGDQVIKLPIVKSSTDVTSLYYQDKHHPVCHPAGDTTERVRFYYRKAEKCLVRRVRTALVLPGKKERVIRYFSTDDD